MVPAPTWVGLFITESVHIKQPTTEQERGRKLHVVIVDAKERRTLAKREGEMETPEAMSESLRRKPKPAAKGKKCSDEDSD